jgi:hypothetical protein
MPISWPTDIIPNSLSFWLQPNAVGLESPINRARQVLARDGTRWMCELDFTNLTPIAAGRVHALIARMKGGAETVALWDFARPTPKGSAAPWPGGGTTTTWSGPTLWSGPTTWSGPTPPTAPALRTDVAAGAESLPTWGWAASALVLRAGDRLGLGGRLYMVTDDAGTTTDSVGRATVSIAPPLRVAALAGDAIATTSPTTTFEIAGNDAAQNRITPNGLGNHLDSLTLRFMESLR